MTAWANPSNKVRADQPLDFSAPANSSPAVGANAAPHPRDGPAPPGADPNGEAQLPVASGCCRSAVREPNARPSENNFAEFPNYIAGAGTPSAAAI